MNRALIWGVLCGAVAGAIMGWALGSTPIGIAVVVLVGAITAFIVYRREPKTDR